MPDIDTIIAKWKASFAGRTRYEGQEPREDELLVAEVERLRTATARRNDTGQAIGRIRSIVEAEPYTLPLDRLTDRVAELQRDAARLDWLADVDNPVGNVQLPTEAVMANLDDMRAAIDEAMHYEPHPTEPGVCRRKGEE